MKKCKLHIRQLTACIACGVLLVQALVPSLGVSAENVSDTASVVDPLNSELYADYYSEYSAIAKGNDIVLNGTDFTSAENPDNAYGKFEDKSAALLGEKNKWCEWRVSVPTDAVYALYPTYCQIPGTRTTISVSVTVDGEFPYTEAASFTLPRLWRDGIEDGAAFSTDAKGGDVRPQQVEVQRWYEYPFTDVQGLYSEPYMFYLSAGVHVIRLESPIDSFMISALRLGFDKEPVYYKDYIAEFNEADYLKTETVTIQAEYAYEKNSKTLYPTYDRASADITPYDASDIKMNTIGQTNWSKNGEFISWKASVAEAGLYKIAFHAHQSFNQGMSSYRGFRVNGEYPFAEAKSIEFVYDSSWYIKTLGNGNEDYYVYLKPGDIISLECTPGAMGDVLRGVQENVRKLNDLYREILIITGSSPDIYRDYKIEKQIPDVSERMLSIRDELESLMKRIEAISGSGASQASTILQMSEMLDELGKDPYYITRRFSNFKTEIENLASLILSLQEQPLELDWIAFVPQNREIPSGKAGFFKNLAYGFNKFLYSFTQDYDSLENEDTTGKTLNLWVSTGRDQAQVLNNMISSYFTPQYNVNVKLSLIDTGNTMLQAALAGKGPDLAIMVAADLPVNLAMRDGLVDLSKYDFSELKSVTTEAAWAPLYYNGGLYGVPESEIFELLFYRTDIFKELDITPPDTWDDFYEVMKVLQSNHLQVGLLEVDGTNLGVSAGIGHFNKFLFQNGGTYYNDALTATLFDTEVSYQAFEKWVELYSRYKIDRDFNFYNRFRNGEMPMSIQGYNMYNQLMSAAPEIKGLWAVAPIPGTAKADGSVDRTESSTVTASIVLNAAEKHGVVDECVDFIRWWTGSEMQAKYGNELEAVLGVASRYSPASIEALEQISWTVDELSVLKEQRESLYNVPQIPGNYVVTRSLTSAFRSALNGNNTPRRALLLYNDDINKEITRKRKEFGLEGGTDK